MKKHLLSFYKTKSISLGFILTLFSFSIDAQVRPNLSFSNCIIQAKDGGFVLTGKTYPNGGDISAIYVVKLDSIGNVKWTKTIGGKTNEYANSMIQAKDGSFILVGEVSGDVSGVDITCSKIRCLWQY